MSNKVDSKLPWTAFEKPSTPSKMPTTPPPASSATSGHTKANDVFIASGPMRPVPGQTKEDPYRFLPPPPPARIQGSLPTQTRQVTNIAETYQMLATNYGTGHPISITKVQVHKNGKFDPAYQKDNTFLVGLSGTEIVKGQATGFKEDFQAAFEQPSRYFEMAKKQLLANAARPLNGKKPDLIITGHSLGGYIAQQLASDPDIKARYNVKVTVTFGSPLVRNSQREGEIVRVVDAGDWVPGMSLNAALEPGKNHTEVIRRSGAKIPELSGLNPIAAHFSYDNEALWRDLGPFGKKDSRMSIQLTGKTKRFGVPTE